MKGVKNDLQTVTKEFKALTKKMGQLTTTLKKTAVDELGRAQAAIKLKTPAQHAVNRTHAGSKGPTSETVARSPTRSQTEKKKETAAKITSCEKTKNL